MSHDTDNRDQLPWSGERYVPQIAGNIRLEHLHRYLLARRYCQGKRVLDIASGEGYGSALLAEVAERVVGVDLSAEAVAHARRCYSRPTLTFTVGDCTAIPLADGSVDVVVSFETIEHHAQHDAMIREIKRVLGAGGTLIISSPDKREYSDVPGYANPFHVRELYREDLEILLGTYFRHVAIGGQRIKAGSVIWPLGDDVPGAFTGFETSDEHQVRPLGPPLYLLAVASDQPVEPLAPGLFDGGAFVWFADHVNAFQAAEATYHEQLRLLNESKAAAEARADRHAAEANSRAAALEASTIRVTALEADAAALSTENAALQRSLNETIRHDQQLANEIAVMTASHSWRVTAPLRALRRTTGARRPPVLTLRQAGLGAYRALPLSVATRLKIKSALFRALPFVFQRTSTYRAWDAYRRTPAPLELPAAGASDVAAATLPTWYYEDVEHDYVPIAQSTGVDTRIKAIAFYLPQFHPTPENDRWWGKGFTEWTNVSRGKPQFAGHYQPHLPGELGFYDLRVLDVQRRQIELARTYGLHGFCYHHYWFGGRKLLHQPLDQLLANPDLDFPFCLCWANENWTRRWDGQESDILIGQQHSAEDDLAFIKDIEPALRDRRYIRVGGRPLLVVYRPALLPDASATAARWRHYCREAGIGEIYLLTTHAFDRIDPHALGFDAAMEFAPNNLGAPAAPDLVTSLNPNFRGTVYDYRYLVAHSRAYQADASYVLFRTVTPMWDNEARRPGRGSVFAHSTPARYREMLENACRYTEQHLGPQLPFVFINAWNEWAEGAHLEPDRRYGYAYLQATADALRQYPAGIGSAEGVVAPGAADEDAPLAASALPAPPGQAGETYETLGDPMSPILDSLRQLKRNWQAGGNQPPATADDRPHAATLDRILSQPIEQRSLRQVLGETSGDFWLWCFTEGYRQDERLRALLPGFPPEDVQYRFTGAAGDHTMREGFSIYSLVMSLASQHLHRPLESVLEFGCGWGRIIRWFLHDIEPDRLLGIDCMPEAIEWCRSTNRHNRFELVDPFPPSTVPSASFDLIYSYSVFSHLSEAAHLAWLAEFKRILKPGGLLIATTRPREFILTCARVRESKDEREWAQGTVLAFKDTKDALARFDRGEFLYEGTGGGGVLDASFFGETCIPLKYVTDHWTKLFEFVEFVDDRQKCDQNLIVVRKAS